MKDSLPYSYALHLDWDYPWPEHWVSEWKALVKYVVTSHGLTLEKIIMKESPSRQGGKHIWIHIASPRELSDDEINMLQWLLLDHHTRVWINILRTQRGLRRFWNKLFTRHLWVKPLPKNCQKCRILKILKEMREKYVETHNPHDST
jgi:hypothetical protein